MPTYTRFRGTLDISECDFTNSLGHNIASFIDWAFLEIGSFYNTYLTQSGAYGGFYTKLRPVDEPYYNSGQVWEGFRGNWVHESSLEYSRQPISISGIWINNVFQPTTGVGTYAFNINYPLGRIIFDNPVDLFNRIDCEFSYKYVNVSTTEVPWARNIISDSMRVDNPQFNFFTSGVYAILGQSRVNLPAIIVDPTTNVTIPRGLELGGGHIRNQEVLIHVLAETPQERNNIADKFLRQKDKIIFLYNINLVASSGKFPLTMDGYLYPSGLLYPGMVDENLGYRERKCHFTDVRSFSFDDDRGLYRAIIKIGIEAQIPEV